MKSVRFSENVNSHLNTLSLQVNDLNREIRNLDEIKFTEEDAEYFSKKVYDSQANQNVQSLREELEAEKKHYEDEGERIREDFEDKIAFTTACETRKQTLITAIQNAACALAMRTNEQLQNISDINARKQLIVIARAVSHIFLPYIQLTVHPNFTGLAPVLGQGNQDFIAIQSNFAKNLTDIQIKLGALGHAPLVQKIKNGVREELQALQAAGLNIVISNDICKSTLDLNDQIKAQDFLATVTKACAQHEAKCAPQRRPSREHAGAPPSKVNQTRALIEKAKVTIQQIENKKSELKQNSQSAIEKLKAEILEELNKREQLKSNLDKALKKLESPTASLNDFTAFDLAFQAANKPTGNNKLLEKIKKIDSDHGGKIFSEEKSDLINQLNNSLTQFNTAIESARITHKSDSFQKNFREHALIGFLKDFIEKNCVFFNKQLTYGGGKEIRGIKVPQGVAEIYETLSSNKNASGKISDLHDILEKRKKAGKKRFVLFTVRSEETDKFYALTTGAINATTHESIQNCKKQIENLIPANTPALKATAQLSSRAS